MKIDSIRFKNYKAFKLQQEIQIKPVTIIIGKNSSGKSAVSRLPLLLSNSLSPQSTSPVELQFENLEFGGSFKDLVHNKIDHGSISLGITITSDDDSKIEIDATIQNIADSPIQFITEYEIKYGSDFSLKFEWIISTDIKTSTEMYMVSGSFEGYAFVNFKGLLIETINFVAEDDSFDQSKINFINQSIWDTFKLIDYIGPFRDLPKRDYIYKGSKPLSTGYSGQFAPQILGIDSYLEKNIITAVGDWYQKNLGGWKLEIEKIREKFEIVLSSPDDPNVKINLVDVGHGMSQVLPFIVRSFVKNAHSDGIMIIEQPELHLHPAAHGVLMELFVDIIKKENSSWIIETHSEILILRIRRMIAEKKIAAEDVIIYVVDDEERPGSILKKVTIDVSGEVDNWPKGIFSEDYAEVIAIRNANLKG